MQKITNQELGRATTKEYAEQEKLPIVAVLDGIRSLHNVGSFFRTADAFAIERIILCGITGTPPNREIHKTALGAEQTVEWSFCETTIEVVEMLKKEDYRLIAVEQVRGAVMLNEYVCESGVKYALVFGNEVFGVGQEVVARCDQAIELPQIGTKHSLNVAVCGGVVLWHFFSSLMALR